MIRRSWKKFSLASALLCFFASAAFAGTVSGTITNGTTGKVASGVQVILIQLMGGMKPVANTKSDAQGHYQFDNPLLGQGPMLLRAVYRGVLYHEPVTPGTTNVNIDVFEPTSKANAIDVTAHAIIVQPSGPNLNVDEEYNIDNNTKPPLAFYRSGGTFKFTLPAGAQISQVTAGIAAAGMPPVIQSTTDVGNNEKAIDYAFRPGSSRVGITYTVPYPSNQTQLNFSSPYTIGRLAIFAPPTVQVAGGDFAPAGSEQGFNAYLRQSVAPNTPVEVAISGTAPPPADDAGNGDANSADNSQNPSVNSHVDDGAQTAPVATVTTLPARIDSLKWIVVGGFVALFALGLIFVLRQPQVAPATPDGEAAALPPAPAKKSAQAKPVRASASAAASDAKSAPAAVATAEQLPTETEVEHEVRGSLDELKDSLFRLELRREAGTISEEEYLRRRDRVQKTLRDLVKG
ncbi:MAG TPA: carboxypeptidase-like regulatory domain-containing protein [Candidatus Dormibacteraeota bacterium]|nr:carboxypeptidase-like regulatory domain-containing protein [Candidatus Dormibacteraeota bacterium]